MKTECDKNGLEYELLMQEQTKQRFLRQIKSNAHPFMDLSKNLVILKQKRDSEQAPKEVVAAPEPQPEAHSPAADPVVAAPNPEETKEENVKSEATGESILGMPMTAFTFGKLSGIQVSNFLDSLRSRMNSRNEPPRPAFPTFPPLTTRAPTRAPSSRQPFQLSNIIVQPSFLQ